MALRYPPSPPLSQSPEPSAPFASTSHSPYPSASSPPSPPSSTSRRRRPAGDRAPKKLAGAGGAAKKRAAREEDGTKLCEAVDRAEVRCEQVVVGGEKGKVRRSWCLEHEAEQAGLRREFERLLVPPSPLTPPLSAIAVETSADRLKTWEEHARATWGLADKALRSRTYHRRHFHAAAEFGRDVVQPLKRIRDELEARMRALNSRSHALILTSEDASWLLPETLPSCSPSHPPPFHPPSPSSDLRPPSSPPLQTFAEEPDPVAALDRVRRAELLELISLTGSHASFIRDSRKSVERVRVVECLMRRVISRDEVLLVRAYRGGHDHVLRFFEDPLCCTLTELSRLWALLQQTTVVQIKEAVMDAFRAMKWEESGAGETEDGEEGLGLQLIGGWTYKIQLAREMEWTAWDHVYDLVGCPNCALRICSSFAEWARIRRLTVVPHGSSPPPYELWGDADESDASRILRALDVVKCGEQRATDDSHEVRRVAAGFVGAGKGKGVWVERQERNWVYLRIGLSHPRAASILAFLHATYASLIRASHQPATPLSAFAPPPHAALWFSRHRSSASRPSLRHEPWATDPHAFAIDPSELLRTTFADLPQLSTEQTTVASEWTDATFDVLVLDAFGRTGEGSGRTPGEYVSRSFEKFEAELGEGVARAVGVEGVHGALEWGEAESYRRGEMLWDFGRRKGDKKAAIAPPPPTGKEKDKTTKAVLDSLRDDALAFRLSRSLFK